MERGVASMGAVMTAAADPDRMEEGAKCRDRHVSYLEWAVEETYDGEIDPDLLAEVTDCLDDDFELTGREQTVRELQEATGGHRTILWVCVERGMRKVAPRENFILY